MNDNASNTLFHFAWTFGSAAQRFESPSSLGAGWTRDLGDNSISARPTRREPAAKDITQLARVSTGALNYQAAQAHLEEAGNSKGAGGITEDCKWTMGD